MAMADFITYIYALTEPDDITKIRYVGKTNNLKRRYSRHIKDGQDEVTKNPLKVSWIKSILDRGERPQIRVLDKCEGYAWTVIEPYWVESLRTLGCDLTNIAKGGLGDTGPVTDEARQKMREKRAKQIITKESRLKAVETRKKTTELNGYYFSPETCEHLSKINMGHHVSEETRQKSSESHKGQRHTPESIRKQVESNKITLAKKGKKITEKRECYSCHEIKIIYGHEMCGKCYQSKRRNDPIIGKNLKEQASKYFQEVIKPKRKLKMNL